MGDLLQVIIELEIGEGLVMNCVVHIENKVSLAEGEHGFRMILKLFFKQLYEAK